MHSFIDSTLNQWYPVKDNSIASRCSTPLFTFNIPQNMHGQKTLSMSDNATFMHKKTSVFSYFTNCKRYYFNSAMRTDNETAVETIERKESEQFNTAERMSK